MESTTSKKETFLSSLLEGTAVVSSGARNQLETLSFPTRKTEDWRYTRIGKLLNQTWQINDAPAAISINRITGLDTYKIVIANGKIVSLPSDLEPGLTISELSGNESDLNSLVEDDHIFSQINTGYAHAGIYIHVTKNVIVSKPIEFIQLIEGENTLSQIRKLIIADKSSSLHVIDSTEAASEQQGFTNSVTEVFVKENSNVHIDKIQNESMANWQINSEYVRQESNTNFTINTITLNGGFVRNGLNIKVDGSNCQTNLNSLYLLRGKQHVDNHTIVDHMKPNCTSSELYKGIIDDEATGVFNGKVFVREDAQKIEAYQQNNNIIMTDTGTMNSKPELEICADDVKCSHGSTTGQFDETAVFYLRARGISEKKARKMLVAAFAGDVLEKITNESVRTHVDEQLRSQFGWEV